MVVPQITTISDKGSYLMHTCRAFIRFLDSSTDRTDASGDLADGNYCRGYFNGLTAYMDTSSSHVCLHKASNLTLIRVYVLYMDKNPKLNDEEMGTGAYFALLDNYPCPAKN